MEKNGLLQTFFYDFLKIQGTNYGSFEEMKKGTSAIHGTTFFFYQKGHGVMKKGHGATPNVCNNPFFSICSLKLISHYNDNFSTCYKPING
jgi:hypothetical protein